MTYQLLFFIYFIKNLPGNGEANGDVEVTDILGMGLSIGVKKSVDEFSDDSVVVDSGEL